jgi:hypothetical protein
MFMTELTADERQTLKAAMRSVGIAPGETGTAAQRSLAARTAREQIEESRPLVVKTATPMITKASSEAQAERVALLTKMSTSPAYSNRINRVAARALRLLQKGGSVHDAEVAAWTEETQALVDRREEFKAARAMRDGAEGPNAPIVRAAAQALMTKMLSEDLAAIKQINKRKGY